MFARARGSTWLQKYVGQPALLAKPNWRGRRSLLSLLQVDMPVIYRCICFRGGTSMLGHLSGMKTGLQPCARPS